MYLNTPTSIDSGTPKCILKTPTFMCLLRNCKIPYQTLPSKQSTRRDRFISFLYTRVLPSHKYRKMYKKLYDFSDQLHLLQVSYLEDGWDRYEELPGIVKEAEEVLRQVADYDFRKPFGVGKLLKGALEKLPELEKVKKEVADATSKACWCWINPQLVNLREERKNSQKRAFLANLREERENGQKRSFLAILLKDDQTTLERYKQGWTEGCSMHLGPKQVKMSYCCTLTQKVLDHCLKQGLTPANAHIIYF